MLAPPHRHASFPMKSSPLPLHRSLPLHRFLARALAAVLAAVLPPLAALAAGSPAASPAAAPEGKRMNVLFIISDDLRVEIGSYGGSLAQTPSIDRLASQGVRFERAYCQYPLCGPSRSSMLTGRPPTTTNIYGNREWIGVQHPDWVTLPRHFRNQGYTTLRTGKIFHEGLDDTDAWVKGGEARIHGEDAARPLVNTPRGPLKPEENKAHVERMRGQDNNRAKHSDRWEAVEGEKVAEQRDTLVADKAIEYLRDPARK